MLDVAIKKSNTRVLELLVTLESLTRDLDAKSIQQLVNAKGFDDWFILDEGIISAVDEVNAVRKGTGDTSKAVFNFDVAERRDAHVTVKVSDDKMEAQAFVTSPQGGKDITPAKIAAAAQKAGIKKGVSKRQIHNVVRQSQRGRPGEVCSAWIARGKVPINGEDTKFEQVIPCSRDRILKPQEKDGGKVDMRDLGSVVCVKPGELLMIRKPPTEGKAGFDVTGEVLEPTPGEDIQFNVGSGTKLDENNENHLVSTMVGMPKTHQNGMAVDQTFVVPKVDVASGHISFEGAIIVNGDVKERMRIKAEGDVTISGFVESGLIEAGGDVVIMQGAAGRKWDSSDEHTAEYSCQIFAKGDVHVQHALGIEIHSGGKVTIGRQISHSKVTAKGPVIVGPEDNPNGRCFSCDVFTDDSLRSGILGAVSGSKVNVYFNRRLDAINKKILGLEKTQRDYQQKLFAIRDRLQSLANKPDKEVKAEEKINLVQNFKKGNMAVNFMKNQVEELNMEKEDYLKKIQVIATKQLFTGLQIYLQDKIWRNDVERRSARLSVKEGKWDWDPFP